MTLYSVLAPPADAGSASPEPDRFVFVKEGFCWPAFYITAPWLILHGMWLVLAAYVSVAAIVLALVIRAPPPIAWAVMVLFSVLVGLEGNNLRRWVLERRGYRFLGIATGDRQDEAEYRFFAAWWKQKALDETQKTARRIVAARAGVDEIVGVFPASGGWKHD